MPRRAAGVGRLQHRVARVAVTLAADVGATHTRVALVDARGQPVQAPEDVATATIGDLGDFLGHCVTRCGLVVDAAGIAIAGPVVDGAGTLTNGSLATDARGLAARLGVPVSVVNDLQAQAWGLDVLAAHDVAALESAGASGNAFAPGSAAAPGGAVVPGHAAGAPARAGLGGASPAGLRLVITPGTGFSIAANVDGRRMLASEVGHADAAAGNALERELLGLLAERFPRVTWEHVLSAPGLANVHAALAQVWGVTQRLSPEVVTHRALVDDEPLARHAVETWAGWLGAFAGGSALTWLARGGVFLAGNLVTVLADVLAAGGFRRRFDDHAPLAALVRAVPVFRVRTPMLPLLGAARAGRLAAGREPD
jgi:glucokinase